MKNPLTLKNQAIDPLQVLTREGHPPDRRRFLVVNVSNNAEECLEHVTTYFSIHFLLIITERPSTCDVTFKMNTSDLEHMRICSVGLLEAVLSEMFSSFRKRGHDKQRHISLMSVS